MAYKRALDLDQTSPDIFLAGICLAERRGDLDGVSLVYEKAVEFRQTIADLFIFYIRIMGRGGYFDKAEIAFDKAGELKQDTACVFAAFISAAAKCGQFLKGIEVFYMALKEEIKVNGAVYEEYILGIALKAHSRFPEGGWLVSAKKFYNQALQEGLSGSALRRVYQHLIKVIKGETPEASVPEFGQSFGRL